MEMLSGATPPPRRLAAIRGIPTVCAVCVSVLCAAAATAQAQRPPRAVAVIDATAAPVSDADVSDLAGRLEGQLERESDLVLVVSDRRFALVGAIPDDERPVLVEARAALGRARDALARFDSKAAVDSAGAAIDRLVSLTPTAEVTALIADLALVRGLAELGAGAAPEAGRSFGLVHRLAPERTLDPARYLPEVVAAFAAAGAAADMTTLDVTVPGGAEVWVDGADVGPAPASIQVAPGLHCVTITADRLVTQGELATVPASGASLTLEPVEASRTTLLQRQRRRLAAATDDATAAAAVSELLRMIGGQDAIVVGRDGDGQLVTRIYSGRGGWVGEPHPTEGRDVDTIIKPLRPIKPVAPPDDGDGKVVAPPPPPEPWYRRRWVQASIGGTVVAGLLTSVVIALTRDPGHSTVDMTGFP